MKKINFLQPASATVIVITALAILLVSIEALVNPQAVMDLVQVKLTNTDAVSSIRAVYGGIGVLLVVQLVYLLYTNQMLGLVMVALFGGLYAGSRLLTIIKEGSLGAFGTQWLYTEATLCATAVVLLIVRIQKGHRIKTQ